MNYKRVTAQQLHYTALIGDPKGWWGRSIALYPGWESRVYFTLNGGDNADGTSCSEGFANPMHSIAFAYRFSSDSQYSKFKLL